MNRKIEERNVSGASCPCLKFNGLLTFSILLSFLAVSTVTQAQDESSMMEPPPEYKAIPAKNYTFQMLLNPGVDVTVRIKSIPNKKSNEQTTEQEVRAENAVDQAEKTMPETVIQREIRSGIVRVSETVGDDRSKTVRYFAGGWTSSDDPRRGLNVKRPNINGPIYPMNAYHFPELLWATPRTRQVDPPVKEGERQINLYKSEQDLLEVDAATQRPIRYRDGEMEWKYSYTEDSSPIAVPEKIATALGRVLPKRKR